MEPSGTRLQWGHYTDENSGKMKRIEEEKAYDATASCPSPFPAYFSTLKKSVLSSETSETRLDGVTFQNTTLFTVLVTCFVMKRQSEQCWVLAPEGTTIA